MARTGALKMTFFSADPVHQAVGDQLAAPSDPVLLRPTGDAARGDDTTVRMDGEQELQKGGITRVGSKQPVARERGYLAYLRRLDVRLKPRVEGLVVPGSRVPGPGGVVQRHLRGHFVER